MKHMYKLSNYITFLSACFVLGCNCHQVRCSTNQRIKMKYNSLGDFAPFAGRPKYLILAVAFIIFASSMIAGAQSDKKKDEKKEDKKLKETLKIQRVTQGMGFYGIGPMSPDKQSVLLLAQKPEQAPNVYVMNLIDRSIRPPLTSFKWGATDPQWSPDGKAIAVAGYEESGTFCE